MHRPCTLPFLLALFVTRVASAASADEPSATLRLPGGGLTTGHLITSDRPGVLAWQADAFTGPFAFAADAVDSIQWPAVQPPPRPIGAFRFELDGGDTLFGNLAALDSETVTFDLGPLGRRQVRRDVVRRVDRWGDGSSLVYLGPSGLNGWKPAPENAWYDSSGMPVTQTPGATLSADLGLPARATIEVELSWERQGDFALVLGSGQDDRATRRAFRLEVWGGRLVAVRETETDADLAEIGAIADGPGQVTLRLFLDQEAGRLLVYATEGREIAELKLPARNPLIGSGVELRTIGGDLRLNRLQIARWDGSPPRVSAAGGQVARTDGSSVEGRVLRLEETTRALIVRSAGVETAVPLDQVTGFALEGGPTPPPSDTRLIYQDGTRLSGTLRSVDGATVTLVRPGFEGLVELPRDSLRSIALLRRTAGAPVEGPARVRIELDDGSRLPGRLIDAIEAPGRSCLAWLPEGSATPAALRPGLAGRVIFREPPPPAESSTRAAQEQRIRLAPARAAGPLRVLDRFRESLAASRVAPPRSLGPTLHLRSGDTIPCEVTRIDEEGVHFQSPMTESKFVPHAKIKALDLAPLTPKVRVGKQKRERLLTLPRMQKDSPPTQLIRSRSGDYIRGRLVAMDDAMLRVELRLEERDVDRDLVAHVIWLHADELETSADPASATPEGDGATRIQAVRSDGTRLTFHAERLADGTLIGISDVLGACRVALAGVDRIAFGPAIEREAAELAAHRWKLRHAPEPRFASIDPEGGASSGTQSALIGQPAPEFEIELLDGHKFRLADQKGHVVILDFWATWCGPCLQAMPQVERIAREFADRGVRLVAVNLQESPDEIRAMLDRHGLSPEVALDREGVVAQKFGADAIPQTVIVDRDGKVARLYVGGGPQFEQTLREALEAILPSPAPPGTE